MGEIVTCIATKLAGCLWDEISRDAHYLFCFNKYIGDVKKAKRELKVKLADVKMGKEDADRKNEEITPSVKQWLEDVNAVLEEVERQQQELEGEGNNCFNVSLRISLAKQMEDKAKQMKELESKSNFNPFALPVQPPRITYLCSKDFVDFNSRKLTFNNLVEAIKDGKNKMIGLYGMGGSGKTSLAKEVGKKVLDLKPFDKVIFVVVSRPPNVVKLQQDIAEQVDLEFSETTQSARAQKLSERLKKKKILIILDDVWECLRLEDIGIPLVEGCHILLTTRLRNVCVSMDCEPMFELPLISKEEAWELFKKHAHLSNDPSNMFNVGKKIIDECKELPIAIVVVASSLKGKRIEAWELALRRLQTFQPFNVEPGLRSPYACLKLSYDSLPSPTVKSLFLLCSVFPEDHEIHKEDLIRFGKGTIELDESVDTMEGVRREISVALYDLLDSCLLMHTDEQACVKMHDLVRDVALWITKEQGQAILVDTDAVSRMMVRNETLKETKAISLWNLENNFKLFNQLHCPTLEILLLHSAEGFFEDLGGIESLKVLALVTFSFDWRFSNEKWIMWSMPQSIASSLMNLHTLCFRGIALGDISFLCLLKRLEILDLRRSQFDELPGGIVDMKKLKLLDVFGCEIEKSPLEVIQKCEQLEELYIWEKKSLFPKNFSLSGLERYVIYNITSELIFSYNDPSGVFTSCDEPLRILFLQGFKVSDSSMKDLILRANSLGLKNCMWDHKDINVNIKHLSAFACTEKRFIVDSLGTDVHQTGQVFPHLITLMLTIMNSLEQVFQDSSNICSLPMLQELYIEYCPKLTTIFTHATIISLPKLRTLYLRHCGKVKYLAVHCPSLEKLDIKDCDEFERLIQEEVAHGDRLLHERESHHDLPNYPQGNETEKITISDCSEPVSLDEETSHEDVLVPLLLKLKHLTLEELPKLREIFGGRFEHKLEALHNKHECSLQKDKNETVKIVNLELISIHLQQLGWDYIWKGPTQCVSLHRLERVELWWCPKLRNIFTFAIVTRLPELRELMIFKCDKWEGIFCEESLKNLSSSSNVCFPKLQFIWITDCNKVKRLFSYSLASHCPSLEKVTIEDCSQFEGVVQGYEGEAAGHHEKLFPKLNNLELKMLPKLREIYPNDYEFNHLSGIEHIEDCPNIRNTPLQHKSSSDL